MERPQRLSTKILKELERFKYSSDDKLLHKFIGLSIDFFPIYLELGLIVLLFLSIDPIVIFVLTVLSFIYSAWHFYKIFFESEKVKLKQYSIEVSDIKEGFKFIFVSDIHYGKEYYGASRNKVKKIIDLINSRNLDLVILGGDFVCNSLDSSIAIEYSKLKSKNVIAVYGNHDSLYLKGKQSTEFPNEFLETMKGSNIIFLNNETFEYKGVTIGGVPDLYSLNIDIDKTFEDKKGNKILISHNPDILDLVKPEDNISLILSGHTHGGQIYLPVVGPVLPVPCRDKRLVKGIYSITDKMKLFISEGAGYSSTRFRLGTTCEVCEITVRPLA